MTSRAGQRIDNFLSGALKGVPKSHVYQILRTGQVRVNSGRVDATYRLQARRPGAHPADSDRAAGGQARARAGVAACCRATSCWRMTPLLVLNKPAGVAAHGGSGVSRGVIEQLRLERPELRFLELVHRLDRDTSGVLLLAKKRSALTALHEQIRAGSMRKWYLTLVAGHWSQAHRDVQLPLTKFVTAAGERRVNVDRQDGMPSHTLFRLLRALSGLRSAGGGAEDWPHASDPRAPRSISAFRSRGTTSTGISPATAGSPSKASSACSCTRLRLSSTHPATGLAMRLEAPLPADLQAFLDDLDAARRAWRRPDMGKQFDLLVFDWDGTVVDSAGHIVDSIQAACRDLDLAVPSPERARYIIGLGLADAMAYLLPDLPPSEYVRLAERYRFHYLAGDHRVTLFEGLREGLGQLHARGFLLGCGDRQEPARARPRPSGLRLAAVLSSVALRG